MERATDIKCDSPIIASVEVEGDRSAMKSGWSTLECAHDSAGRGGPFKSRRHRVRGRSAYFQSRARNFGHRSFSILCPPPAACIPRPLTRQGEAGPIRVPRTQTNQPHVAPQRTTCGDGLPWSALFNSKQVPRGRRVPADVAVLRRSSPMDALKALRRGKDLRLAGESRVTSSYAFENAGGGGRGHAQFLVGRPWSEAARRVLSSGASTIHASCELRARLTQTGIASLTSLI